MKKRNIKQGMVQNILGFFFSKVALGFTAGTKKPLRSAGLQHSSASNSTSNFEITSHEQFYVPLAPPHRRFCPASEWSKVSPEIIFSHAWCVFGQ